MTTASDEQIRMIEASIGRVFDLRLEGDCRGVDHSGVPNGIRAILPAGTRVQLVEVVYDTMITRAYHRLRVLSGDHAGETVSLMIGIGEAPWE